MCRLSFTYYFILYSDITWVLGKFCNEGRNSLYIFPSTYFDCYNGLVYVMFDNLTILSYYLGFGLLILSIDIGIELLLRFWANPNER